MIDSRYFMRFVGKDLKPNTVAASQLAELISAFENVLVEKAIELNPDVKREDLLISLVSITDSSIGMGFQLQNPAIFHPAIIALSNDINHEDYSSYTGKRKESIKKIIQFSRNYNCEAQLIEGEETAKALAVISPETELIAPPLLTGKTTVYGKIVSVGGKTPNVHLEVPSGNTVICGVSVDQARELAGRLYDWVGLYGKARWNSEEYEIQDFNVERIIEYSPGAAKLGLDEARKISGRHFADISDVKKFVNELRNGDMEDS